MREKLKINTEFIAHYLSVWQSFKDLLIWAMIAIGKTKDMIYIIFLDQKCKFQPLLKLQLILFFGICSWHIYKTNLSCVQDTLQYKFYWKASLPPGVFLERMPKAKSGIHCQRSEGKLFHYILQWKSFKTIADFQPRWRHR